MQVLEVDAVAQSGLDAVYVAPGLENVKVSYIANGNVADVKWYRYSSMGGGYMQEVSTRKAGKEILLTSVEGDMGYIIEDGDDRYSFWVVDYSAHQFELNSLAAGTVDCDRLELIVDGSGDEIAYYGINGRRFVLSREIELKYNTLSYDEQVAGYVMIGHKEVMESLSHIVYCESPLCATDFMLTGDRFLRAWDREADIRSSVIVPKAVKAVTNATQVTSSTSNQESEVTPSGYLGGSAPCEISFSAVVTDAAVFTEWQISDTPDFEEVEFRTQEMNYTHKFSREGNSYVRFVCADATGECEYYSEPYTVAIGASSLKCPNAFSPGNADGVNDEWKVAYYSIVSFRCHIFNRYGQELAVLTDPSQGWDGRYNGKFVPAGVYYYVITAEGADSKKYELSGDINIVNYK